MFCSTETLVLGELRPCEHCWFQWMLFGTVYQKCRYGSSSLFAECYRLIMEKDTITCEKPCGSKKNCLRHRCTERCCPLSYSNSRYSGDWDLHLCPMMLCGKKLKSGQHSCESLCLNRHCPPCLEIIFSYLTCAIHVTHRRFGLSVDVIFPVTIVL